MKSLASSSRLELGAPPKSALATAALPPRPRLFRRLPLLVTLLFALLLALGGSALAGPPAILLDGDVYTYSYTYGDDGGNVYAEYYNGSSSAIELINDVLGGIWTYDASSGQFGNISGAPQPTIFALDDSLNFIDQSGLIVISSSPITVWDGSQWVNADGQTINTDGNHTAIYTSLTDGAFFEIGGESPWYRYHPGTAIDGSSDWPDSDVLAFPPSQVYLFDQSVVGPTAFILDSSSCGTFGLDYSDTTTYVNSLNPPSVKVAIIRHAHANGTFSGTLTVTSLAGVPLHGPWSFNPLTWAVATQNPYAISFSAPTGFPSNGRPSYVSANGMLLSFAFSDSAENDYYTSNPDYALVIDPNGNVSDYGTLGIDQSAYTPAGDFTAPNVIGLDQFGNPVGTPGVVASYSSDDGSGRPLKLGDGTVHYPNYTFVRPGGSFGVKYLVSNRKYFMIADSSGSFDSSEASPVYQLHGQFSGSGNLYVRSADTNWKPTNIFPSLLYLNGLAVSLNPNNVWETPPSDEQPFRSGGAYYSYSTGGEYGQAYLTWTWNGTFSGIAFSATTSPGPGSSNSGSGVWDGGPLFTTQSGSVTVSLTPSPRPTGARYGPSSIEWNGQLLTFDATASTQSPANPRGDDIYKNGSGLRLQIAADHKVLVYYAGQGTPAYVGTYLPTEFRFDFGSQKFGTATVLDAYGRLIGASSSGNVAFAGDLDVGGNTLTLGTWDQSASYSTNGLSLTFTNGTGPQSSLITFDGIRDNTEFRWTRGSATASGGQFVGMKLDAQNRLLLFDPNRPTTATVILDPRGKSRLRVEEQGDISMGAFRSEPVAP